MIKIYDRLKIALRATAVFSLGMASLGLNAQAPNDCGIPVGGNTTTGAYNVGNLGLVTGTITNPNYASDRGANYRSLTYTAFSATGATLATTFTETVNFHLTDAFDSVTITAQLPSLYLGVLSAVTAQAYNGTTPVGNPVDFAAVLTGLGLLNTPNPFTIGLVPMSAFDNVKISVSTVLGLTLANDFLRVYDVTVSPTSPVVTDNLFCSTTGSPNTTVSVQSLDALLTGVNLTYNWYLDANTSIVSGTTTSANPDLDYAAAFPTLLATGDHFVYVTTAKTPCTNDTSARVPISITSTTCAILPVSGFVLSGSSTGGFPKLDWQTLTESNSSYFTIESSSDGSTYTKVGKVAAAGSSTFPIDYSFEDKSASGQIVYYRIKAVDRDGTFAYSNIITLNIGATTGFRIFPNPASDFVNIQTGTDGTYLVELFSIDGKKVQSNKLTSGNGSMKFNLNKANIARGLYSIKVSNSSDKGKSYYSTILVK